MTSGDMKRLTWRKQSTGLSTRSKDSGSGTWSNRRSQYGLKTWYQPRKPLVDIVFIHGLTGHFENTWTAKGSSGPWPQTLLPTRIPEARILSFGYDARVVRTASPISNNTVGDHARNLLAALATKRGEDGSTDRPIIFVAHSMGGLVCQDALLASRASPENHLRKILDCTKAIAFMATPHAGTDLADSMGRLARMADGARQVNFRIVEILGRESEVLARVRSDFQALVMNRAASGEDDRIGITCFYEELPVAGIGEVVPKSSATLPQFPAIGIHSDHQGIARFADLEDPGFISVAGELARWTAEIRQGSDEKESIRAEGQKEIELARLGELSGTTLVDDPYHGETGRGGFEDQRPGHLGRGGFPGGITIQGSVSHSTVVNGTQVINGGLVFM